MTPEWQAVTTVLGSGGLAAIVARIIAYREKVLVAEVAHQKAEREESRRIVFAERTRADRCGERLDAVQAHLTDVREELARCETRHSALEERIERLERISNRPPTPPFMKSGGI